MLAGLAARPAQAQTPTQAPAGAKPPAEYTSASASGDVAKPIAAVMARTAGYCAIADWAKLSCQITSGRDGELGAVRLIAGRISEVLVAKTATSYTYAAPLAPNSYQGTVEYTALPGGKATRITYTMFFDLAVQPDQAAKQRETTSRQATAKRFVDGMKARNVASSQRPRVPRAPQPGMGRTWR